MHHFAEAAVIHAHQRHGVQIDVSPQSVAAVDQILDHERDRGEPQEFDSLVLCYGSWLGEVAVRHLAARWVGMHEPHPPRLQIAGVLCSPLDAVTRRLQSAAEPPLGHRLQTMHSWVADFPAADVVCGRNQRAWDRLAHDPKFVRREAIDAHLADPETARAAIDPWLGDLPLPGSTLLCLAAGGGTHSVLHSLAGFRVTVVDISPQMLAIDRALADKYGLGLATVQASMDDLSALEDASFDAVVQPVSACYLPDVLPVYAEVARVLRDGGRYVVQHKQPASMQATGSGGGEGYRIIGRAFAGQRACGDAAHDPHLEPGADEFIHPLGVLLGGLCRSGFVIEDVQEPPRADAWARPGSDSHRACYLPPYLKIKARRRDR